jgi:hypothetical protein
VINLVGLVIVICFLQQLLRIFSLQAEIGREKHRDQVPQLDACYNDYLNVFLWIEFVIMDGVKREAHVECRKKYPA